MVKEGGGSRGENKLPIINRDTMSLTHLLVGVLSTSYSNEHSQVSSSSSSSSGNSL